MSTVYCRDCGLELGERIDVLTEEREPCPECRSKGRWVEVVLASHKIQESHSPTVIESSGEVVAPVAIIKGRGTVEPPAEIVEVLRPTARRVGWLEPLEEGGTWTFQAYDEADDLISMAEQPTWDDGWLAIAEEVRGLSGEDA